MALKPFGQFSIEILQIQPISGRDRVGLLFKRKTEMSQESDDLALGFSSGNYGNRETEDIFEFFIGCFRKDSMFFNT